MLYEEKLHELEIDNDILKRKCEILDKIVYEQEELIKELKAALYKTDTDDSD